MAEPVITDAAREALWNALADQTGSSVYDRKGAIEAILPIFTTFATAAVAADRAQRGADAQGTSINVNDLIAAAVAEEQALIVAELETDGHFIAADLVRRGDHLREESRAKETE